jgi:hypothetical protein
VPDSSNLDDRRKAAYYNWQRRGGPLWDDWTDWLATEGGGETRKNRAEALKLIGEIKAKWASPELIARLKAHLEHGPTLTDIAKIWVSHLVPGVAEGMAAVEAFAKAKELAEQLDRLAALICDDR